MTVCRNNAPTIMRTLESVWNQKCDFTIEHLIIDGKSDDGTDKIIQKAINGCSNPNLSIKYISEKDSGVYDAMNKGIKISRGEYIGFLNGDDAFSSPDTLMGLINAVTNTGADAVYGDVVYANASGRKRHYSSRRFHRWKMIMGLMPAHPTFYCRREHLINIGVFDTRFTTAADFELLFRLIYKQQIRTIYLPGEHVEMLPGGITGKGFKSYWAITRDHLRTYIKHKCYLGIICDVLRYPGKLLEYD